jgi:hypothetical protein
MLQTEQVRDEIIGFLAGKISLRDLDDWIAKNSWNMHKDSPRSAQKLVSEIELRLAEYSAGHLPLDLLRAELARFVSDYTIEPDEPSDYSGSQAQFIEPNLAEGLAARAGQASPSGMQRLVEVW